MVEQKSSGSKHKLNNLPLKVRSFVLTDWNMNTSEQYEKIMESNSIQFLAYGKEICPKTKKAHNQAFFYTWNPISRLLKNLNKIGKWWGDTHCNIAPMYGNFEQNDAYCKKENIYTKLGKEPKQGERGDIRENVEMLTKGEITVDELALKDPINFSMYQRLYEKINNIKLQKNWRTTMTKGYWFWGGTQCGKSHNAFTKFGIAKDETHYVKNLNVMWWDGYSQQDIVIMNEFRGEIKYNELLDLVDKWPKTVPIRNQRDVPFNSKKLVITSSKPPEEIYMKIMDHQEKLEQLERRFEIIELSEKKEEDETEQKCSKVIIDFENKYLTTHKII